MIHRDSKGRAGYSPSLRGTEAVKAAMPEQVVAHLVKGYYVEVVIDTLQSKNLIAYISEAEAPLVFGYDLTGIGCATSILRHQGGDAVLASTNLWAELVGCMRILWRI